MSSSRPLRIAPSILASDFGRLAEEIHAVETAGADMIHVDVMDGRFVNNITVGPVVLKAVRKATTLPLDVHLMIMEPERHIEAFANAGADSLTVHLETAPNAESTLARIRALGKKAAVSVNPQTPIDTVFPLLGDVSMVLVMTVNPGFGGQAFISSVLPKITTLRSEIDRRGLDVAIEADGGINAETAPQVAKAGADILVAGHAVFRRPDYRQAIAELRVR